MILEAIVTTRSAEGQINVAPMGPHIRPSSIEEVRNFELRPFETSTTYKNLMHCNVGVLHITDNVLMLAKAAVGKLEPVPTTHVGENPDCQILDDCCRWLEFKATAIATDSPRKAFHCEVTSSGNRRQFFGFNRAKHAIVEATILATRIDFVPMPEILDQLERTRIVVEKTGGFNENEAFTVLSEFVANVCGQ